MRLSSQLRFGSLAIFGAVLGFSLSSCQLDLDDEQLYRCETTADCGGEGFTCVELSGRGLVCCKPSEEVCDGKDNDCNSGVDDLSGDCYSGPGSTNGVGLCVGGTRGCSSGAAACLGEVTPVEELCNGLDDDCDGTADDGFDLTSSTQHCGACNNACAANEICQASTCTERTELQCGNAADDDGDQLIDCDDPDCQDLACGNGCICGLGFRREGSCADQADNDNDVAIDCADSDCDGGSCGNGCTCAAGAATETLCSDGADNDTDTRIDCADENCDGGSCGTGCQCEAGARIEKLCSDTLDNDGENGADCADSDCNLASCGTGCECRSPNKAETGCNDLNDNDGDLLFDCNDPDCVTSCGTGCNRCNGVNREVNCTDGNDNDADGRADCLDTDCHTGICGTGCVMCNGQQHETVCNDVTGGNWGEANWIDNDGDGLRNCRDTVDCPVGTACRGRSGSTNFTGTCQASGACG